MPENRTTDEAPLHDIAAQMCIFAGCLGRGFNSRGCFKRLNVSLPCLSSATVHSSLKITFSKWSSLLIHCQHHSNLFNLFVSRISWQYLGVVATQPNLFWHLLMIGIDTVAKLGHFSTNNCFNW